MKNFIVILLLLNIGQAYAFNFFTTNWGDPQASIIIKPDNGLKADSLEMLVYGNDYIPLMDFFLPPVKYVSALKNGAYTFHINVGDGPVHFSLRKSSEKRPFMEKYLIEVGDQISIELVQGNISFSGKGSKKNECISKLNTNYIQINDSLDNANIVAHPLPVNKPDTLNYYLYKLRGYFENSAIMLSSQLAVLEKYESQLSPASYTVLRADIYGDVQGQPISSAQFFFMNGNIKRSIESNIDSVKRYMTKYSHFIGDNTGLGLANSPEYMEFLYKKIQFDAYLDRTTFFICLDQHTFIAENLRDKMTTKFICQRLNFLDEPDRVITEKIPMITNVRYTKLLNDLKQTVRRGTSSSNFILTSHNGKMVSLNEFKGKLVFVDFWYTGCGPCRFYYKNVLSHVEKTYRNHPGIVFISISIDKNRNEWMKSIKDGNYTSMDAVNLYTGGKGKNHPVIEEYQINGYPTPMLIDHQGALITRNGHELGATRGGDQRHRLVSTIEKYIK